MKTVPSIATATEEQEAMEIGERTNAALRSISGKDRTEAAEDPEVLRLIAEAVRQRKGRRTHHEASDEVAP